ncbi:hypothetical protein ACHAWF_016765 [Thalassiosira exigua]
MLSALPPLILLLAVSVDAFRDVGALSKWATDHGGYLHDRLAWKDYGGGDFGLVLSGGPVERGTVLLRVPRSLVLDASVLRRSDRADVVAKALGDYAELLDRLGAVPPECLPSPHRFSPWVDAMPSSFHRLSPAEIECLPFYAKYAAQYQEKKLEAFCRCAEALGEEGGFDGNNPKDAAAFEWAFRAVNSRFWKTNPLRRGGEENDTRQQTSELVPIGDMMNHRDPPNVVMVTEGPDHVAFAYMGDDADEGCDLSSLGESYERDLFLTYGQPGNPHRFLVLFGFVPDAECMPRVWSHIAYPETNPYGNAGQADELVFDAKDGSVPQQVWDAILWELWQPSSREEFLRERDERHAKYKDLLTEVLESHLARQLEELASLRPRIEATEGPNMPMIRRHNDFLTSTFTKVKNNLH